MTPYRREELDRRRAERAARVAVGWPRARSRVVPLSAVPCDGGCGRYVALPSRRFAGRVTRALCSTRGGRGCAPLELATDAAVRAFAATGDLRAAVARGRAVAPNAPLRRLGGVLRARRPAGVVR